MNRIVLLCLVVGVGGAAAFAQPPLQPPPVAPLPSPESPPGKTAERPGKPGKDGEAKDKPAPEKKDPPPPAPKNPLEELLSPKPTFQFRGRIEAEAITATQSQESKDVIGNLQNGFGSRRVRLGAQGAIVTSASWMSEVEGAGGNVRLRDVFIWLDALPGVRQIRIGHFREPFSLEGMTSSNFITFLERSPPNEFDPARNWGVAGFWWPESERVLYSLSAFRNGTSSGGQSIGDQGTWAAATRHTGLPVYAPDDSAYRLVHLGGAFSYRNPVDGVVVYAASPASSLLTVVDSPPTPLLPPVAIPANSQQLYNLEAAWVRGPLSLQGSGTGRPSSRSAAGWFSSTASTRRRAGS